MSGQPPLVSLPGARNYPPAGLVTLPQQPSPWGRPPFTDPDLLIAVVDGNATASIGTPPLVSGWFLRNQPLLSFSGIGPEPMAPTLDSGPNRVNFNGNQAFLAQNPEIAGIQGASDLTFMFAVRRSAIDIAKVLFSGNSIGLADLLEVRFMANNTILTEDTRTGVAAQNNFAGSITDDTSLHLITVVFRQGDVPQLSIDAGAFEDGIAAADNVPIGDYDKGIFMAGDLDYGAGSHFGGAWAFMLVYTRALAVGEVQAFASDLIGYPQLGTNEGDEAW